MTKLELLRKLPEHIHIKAKHSTKQVFINGVHIIPDGSLRIRNHSPDGFNWGYGGSGPAQFALGLLMLYVDADTAQLHYQDLKFGWVAGLPQRDLDIHVNLRWVMETILLEGPFQAAKLIKEC